MRGAPDPLLKYINRYTSIYIYILYLSPQAMKNTYENLMPVRLSASLSVCLLARICKCFFEVPPLCSHLAWDEKVSGEVAEHGPNMLLKLDRTCYHDPNIIHSISQKCINLQPQP